MYERSENYNIRQSRHCLWIKQSCTGRPKIRATLSVLKKVGLCLCFLAVSPKILSTF